MTMKTIWSLSSPRQKLRSKGRETEIIVVKKNNTNIHFKGIYHWTALFLTVMLMKYGTRNNKHKEDISPILSISEKRKS